jgi:copper(I)-binding protein
VEVHNTIVEDGLARMIHQERLEIPARGSLSFVPGSYHLMLMGRKTPLQVNDQVDLTLVFENGEEHSATAVVRAEAGATEMKCGSGKCGSGKCGSGKCGGGK